MTAGRDSEGDTLVCDKCGRTTSYYVVMEGEGPRCIRCGAASDAQPASFTFHGSEASLQAEIGRVRLFLWSLVKLRALPLAGATVIALINVAAEMTVRAAPNPVMAEQWTRACTAALARAERELAYERERGPLS